MAKGKKKNIQLRASASPILRYPQISVDKLFIRSVKLLCGAPTASHCLKHERKETKKLRNYKLVRRHKLVFKQKLMDCLRSYSMSVII